MPSETLKSEFSKRLLLALNRHQPSVKGATRLADQFNLRFRGNGVSPQTAHKWLSGRAIPTADKIETLAEWLEVSAHWLHYGPVPDAEQQKDKKSAGFGSSAGALMLAEKIDALPSHQRFIVEQLVREFADKPDPEST